MGEYEALRLGGRYVVPSGYTTCQRNKTTMRLVLNPLAVLGLALVLSRGAIADVPYKVDEYGALKCNEERARLDNLALVFENEQFSRDKAHLIVIVYGGRRDTRRNEVRERMAFVEHYLSIDRKIQRNRLKIIDGGFRESLTTELYIQPPSVEAKDLISATVSQKEVRFRKGTFRNRIRACGK